MPSDEEIIKELDAREEALMTIALTASVEKSAITIQAYIESRILQGIEAATLEAELLRDLNEGGRIFGEFRNAIKATARGNLRRTADIGNYSETGVEIDYTWVTVQDSNVCPDCMPLHGVSRKWDKWEEGSSGLPRSGGTVCRSNCRCFLAMSNAPAMPEKPVIRRKRK